MRYNMILYYIIFYYSIIEAMTSDSGIIAHILTYNIILGIGNWQSIDLTGSSNVSNQRQDGVAGYPSQTL